MRDLPQPPPKLPGGKVPGKVLFVGSLYHQRSNNPTRAVEIRSSRWLESDHTWYQDEFEVEAGIWIEVIAGRGGIGVVTVENLEGMDLLKVPTPDLRRSIASRIVEVAIVGAETVTNLETLSPQQWIRPGEVLPLYPCPHTKVLIRCATMGQKVKVRTTAIPK